MTKHYYTLCHENTRIVLYPGKILFTSQAYIGQLDDNCDLIVRPNYGLYHYIEESPVQYDARHFRRTTEDELDYMEDYTWVASKYCSDWYSIYYAIFHDIENIDADDQVYFEPYSGYEGGAPGFVLSKEEYVDDLGVNLAIRFKVGWYHERYVFEDNIAPLVMEGKPAKFHLDRNYFEGDLRPLEYVEEFLILKKWVLRYILRDLMYNEQLPRYYEDTLDNKQTIALLQALGVLEEGVGVVIRD